MTAVRVLLADDQALVRSGFRALLGSQPDLDVVAEAADGAIGLETLLPICIKSLIEPGHLDWPQLITKLTRGPAEVLGIAKGTLQVGADADVTIIDSELQWTIDPQQFRSLSRNTPFAGWQVHGRAHTVIVGGNVRYSVE